MRTPLPALAAALFLATLAAPNRAAEHRTSTAFLRGLSVPGRAHPMSDRSGRIPLMVALPAGVDARSMGLLPIGPGLATVRVLPDRIGDVEALGLAFSVWPGLHPVLDKSARWNRTDVYRSSLPLTGASGAAGLGRGVVVGILDTGIDATHGDFLDAQGKTRVAWLLDMSRPPAGLHAGLEAQFGCTDPNQTPCAVLSGDDIDRALAGDNGAYVPSDTIGHGTHVTSIAAGSGGADRTYVGGAPQATLVIAGVTQGTGGDLADADIAVGATFIFDRADALGLPAVANLSLGGDFGPHDGSTPLERSLAALVGPDHPGRAIVVAAGNSATLWAGPRPDDSLGIHTEVRVTEDLPAHVPMLSPGHAGGAALSGAVYVWVTYRAGDSISVGLTGPSGVVVSPVPAGQSGVGGNASLGASIDNAVVNEDLGLGAGMHGAVVAWSGVWAPASELTIDLQGEGSVEMWLQGSGDGAPSDTDLGQQFRVATYEQTISVPATAPELIAVGCTVNRTSWTDHAGMARTDPGLGDPDDACYFSSTGPTATGVYKPEISAPGVLVAAAMSRDATPTAQGDRSIFAATRDVCPDDAGCYATDATHGLLSGSSMSSPQVTGAVALLLERDRGLRENDVRDLLMQGARFPSGYAPLDYQVGAGVLDVAGTMDALDARTTPTLREVDPQKSWMGLSTSYARPDPTWALAGNVLLRTADGAVADGFDVARLGLAMSGPVVVRKGLGRVGAGLFAFELAGADDGGQQDIVIDATYDGRSIGPGPGRWDGHRVVPVGADYWIAHGAPSAMGGCRAAPGAPRGGLLSGALAFVAVALSRLRRSSRDRDERRDVPVWLERPLIGIERIQRS
jgi:subtilisin family serine protease